VTAWSPGPRNLITDVAGLLVGNADDKKLKSGVTAILCEEPATAAVQILGGAPGTRETDLARAAQYGRNRRRAGALRRLGLRPRRGLRRTGGTGGSRARFSVGPLRIPIVPAAILFDLINGGDKDWGRYPPYRELGYDAIKAAAAEFMLGSHGAGAGALTADLKGGLGSASAVLPAPARPSAHWSPSIPSARRRSRAQAFLGRALRNRRRIRRARLSASASRRRNRTAHQVSR
jgi:L-aminopeptidase/D-esterase-like protein